MILFSLPGDVLGFESLVYTVFEFVHCLIESESGKYRSTVKQSVDQIIYYIIAYMQMTEDQVIVCIYSLIIKVLKNDCKLLKL